MPARGLGDIAGVRGSQEQRGFVLVALEIEGRRAMPSAVNAAEVRERFMGIPIVKKRRSVRLGPARAN
jgi:hypothetical protein